MGSVTPSTAFYSTWPDSAYDDGEEKATLISGGSVSAAELLNHFAFPFSASNRLTQISFDNDQNSGDWMRSCDIMASPNGDAYTWAKIGAFTLTSGEYQVLSISTGGYPFAYYRLVQTGIDQWVTVSDFTFQADAAGSPPANSLTPDTCYYTYGDGEETSAWNSGEEAATLIAGGFAYEAQTYNHHTFAFSEPVKLTKIRFNNNVYVYITTDYMHSCDVYASETGDADDWTNLGSFALSARVYNELTIDTSGEYYTYYRIVDTSDPVQWARVGDFSFIGGALSESRTLGPAIQCMA